MIPDIQSGSLDTERTSIHRLSVSRKGKESYRSIACRMRREGSDILTAGPREPPGSQSVCGGIFEVSLAFVKQYKEDSL